MAIAVVNSAQTGSTTAATLTITSATATNVLACFICQTSTLVVPVCKDNISGSTGWKVFPFHTQNTGAADSMWFATKIAVGGETIIEPTAGSGGSVTSIAYWELSGCSVNSNSHSIAVGITANTTQVSGAISTAATGCVILLALGLAVSSGTISAWTDTNAGVPTNITTASSCIIGGSYITTTPVSKATFTANWATSRATLGLQAVSLAPSGSQVGTGDMLTIM